MSVRRTGVKAFTVEIDSKVYEKLEKMCEANKRKKNAQIEFLIEEASKKIKKAQVETNPGHE